MISVIVPVYNVKNLLGKCLDSIIGQSYSELEIIVVDDGSTDGSAEECDRYASVDNRISVFHKPNGGLSDARNYGMMHSTGEYFLFIDSDDVIHKDFCRLLYSKMESEHADIVSSDIVNFWNDEQLAELKMTSEGDMLIFENDDILNEYFLPRGKRVINHGLCMKLYKRELFEGLLFDVGKLHEDLYITHKLLSRCSKFVYSDSPYYFYYQKNSNSISNNYGVKNFIDEHECIMQIYDLYFSNINVSDSLLCFCCYHYLFMLERARHIHNEQVKLRKKQIRKWIMDSARKITNISAPKRIKLIFAAHAPHLYYSLRELKNGK